MSCPLKIFRSVGFLLFLLSLFAGSVSAFEGEQPLPIRDSQLAVIQTDRASVFRDPDSAAVTITFDYVDGNAEVRFPLSALGWPTDWSSYASLRYTFLTTSQEPVAVGFSDGEKTKFAITEPLPGIRISGVIPFSIFVQTTSMTPLLPLGYKIWPQRLFTFEKVKELVFQMKSPNQASQLTLYDLTLLPDVPRDDILDKKPLIDRYGQWIPENWPGKAHSDGELRQLWKADVLEPAEYPYCELGGDPSLQLKASGFFRTDQVDGKWVLADPHGHPFYSAGIDLVGYNPGSFATDVQGREFLFQGLPAKGPSWLDPGRVVSFYISNIIKRFGSAWQKEWNRQIVERLRNWGFNTIGNWSDRDLAVHSGMPYVLPLSGWTTEKRFPFPYDFPDVFSDEFARNCDRAAQKQVAELKNDPNLIGWFLGNEPRWARDFGALQSWPDMVLADPDESATKSKLQAMLAEKPNEAQRIKDEFLFTCAQQYFETVMQAVRRYDPNHLILGIRFAGNPEDRWIEMSRMFDVLSLNVYSSTFRPEPERMERLSKLSGRPIMIGEFTAATPGRGLQGLFYYVHKVRDHAERGKAYRYYVEACASSPYIVGAHWFQLVDDLPTGRASDEERLNYGFINVIDLPYPELVNAARATHRRLYELKLRGARPFSEVPVSN
jgi:hypothetical protein